jgi:hypothetical protein
MKALPWIFALLPIVAEPWPWDLGTLVPSDTSDVRPPPPFPFCCSADLLVLVTGILAGTGLWCTLVHWYHWYQWGEAPSGIWFALWPSVLVLFVALICLTGLCCCLWMLVWSELIVAMNWFLSACLTLVVSVVGFWFVLLAVCCLSLLAVMLIHLCGLLLSCTGILVATPVLYVCTCTPAAYTMMAVWLYQLLVQPWTLLCYCCLWSVAWLVLDLSNGVLWFGLSKCGQL